MLKSRNVELYMQGTVVKITRLVEASFPGFVECSLVDADGRTHLFVEKVPVVTLECLDEESDYPTDGVIACEIIGTTEDSVLHVSTRLPWGVESKDGQTGFKIKREKLIKL